MAEQKEISVSTKEELIAFLQSQSTEISQLRAMVESLSSNKKDEEETTKGDDKTKEDEEEISEEEIDEIDALLNRD